MLRIEVSLSRYGGPDENTERKLRHKILIAVADLAAEQGSTVNRIQFTKPRSKK